MEKITRQTSLAELKDFLINTNWEDLLAQYWECSVQNCDKSGRTDTMFSIDIGPFPINGREKVWRPLSTTVLCPKHKDRTEKIKNGCVDDNGHEGRAQVYRLLDLVKWYREEINKKNKNKKIEEK